MTIFFFFLIISPQIINKAIYDLSGVFHKAGYLSLPLSSTDCPTDQRTLIAIFPYKHAAVSAGLGTNGRSGLLITEKFGPRIRLACVLTDAPLEKRHHCQGYCYRCSNGRLQTPGHADLACISSRAEITYCFCQDPEPTPWQTINPERFDEQTTTVYVLKAEPPHDIHNYAFHPVPMVRNRGLAPVRPPHFADKHPTPVTREPSDIEIVVAGGRGGHSSVILPWALHSEAIVEPVLLPNGQAAKNIEEFKTGK